MRKRIWLTAVALLATLPACHRGAVRPPGEQPIPIPKGAVLILPPRDMIQDGVFHAVSPGSGKYLLDQARTRFTAAGWTVLTTDAPEFTPLAIPQLRPAILEGRRQHADYVLRLVLGEFRDAAPMTFRPDFVTLQSAELWSTKNAALVWALERPLESSGNNLPHYHRLIDELAEILADEVGSAEVAPAVFAKEEQLPAESAPAATGMGACTVDQVLAMKNSGMTDAQVKRACGQ